MSDLVEILTAMLNDEHAEDVYVDTRIDKYLEACCKKTGCEGLPDPVTDADRLLYELAEKIAEGGGGGFGFVDTKKLTSLNSFAQAGSNLEFMLDENLDTSNVTNMSYLFKQAVNLTEVTNLNTIKAAQMNSTFEGCTNLQTVATINGTNCWSMSDIFKSCAKLKNLTVVENSIQVDLNVSDCVQLSNESLLSILKGIKKTTGWKTLKLPANKQSIIESDETMNAELAAVRNANWTVQFI